MVGHEERVEPVRARASERSASGAGLKFASG
jgi:hypothetical protein